MNYYLVIFTNRTESLEFSYILKKYRVEHAVVATPKGVGSSCGIAVKIFANNFNQAFKILKSCNFFTLSGIYFAKYDGRGGYFTEKIN